MPSVFKFFARFAPRPKTPRDEAVALLRGGRYEAAIAAIDAMLPAPSASEAAFLLNKRGVALASLGRLDEAERTFREALRLDANNAAALTNLGNVDHERGRPEEALSRYAEAIAADPHYPLAHYNRAAVLKTLGRLDEAVKARRTGRRVEGRFRRKQTGER